MCICTFSHAALWFNQQGRHKGAQFYGSRITGGAEILRGAPNDYGGAEWLWVCRMVVRAPKSSNNVTSTFFNTVDLLPKDLRFEHGLPNLLLAPGTIYPRYAPISQEISSVKKLIHSLLCCETTMQTNCGLTNCTSNSPETGFSFSVCRLAKSWVSYKFSMLNSYF